MELRRRGLVIGTLAGFGLSLSEMVNPYRVIGFLDISGGRWDPTLAFVMMGGLIASIIGYQIIPKRKCPQHSKSFHLPETKTINKSLIIGAFLFGAGWGMAGICPGPAIAGLFFLKTEGFLFVMAMIGGMFMAGRLE